MLLLTIIPSLESLLTKQFSLNVQLSSKACEPSSSCNTDKKNSVVNARVAVEVGALHCNVALFKLYCRISHSQGCDVHKADIEEPNNRALGFTNFHMELMVNDDIFSGFCSSSFYDK